MNTRQAIKLAIECMDKEAHRYAIDANAYALHNFTGPTFQNAYERRQKIEEAKKILLDIPDIPRQAPLL